MLHFAIRNRKEIFRDPLSIILGIALPLILLIVFTTIEKNAPLDTFKAHNLVPGLVVFSFSFLTMFSALLIAKDKQTALLVRLFASPLKVNDYVVGYTIPMIPLVILQTIICYLVALALGMSVELIDFLMSMVVLLPIAIMSIFFGLFLGALFTDKQISGIGTIYITLGSFLSGAWVDLSLLGNKFGEIGNYLPFVHAVELSRDILIGDYSTFSEHFWWTVAYAIILFICAIFAFFQLRKR
ncbi:ABC transporter permease [Bacillus aquiflavi]|uniref:Transport permease protein n=1 Tax=Bacillus aquiflavi TaxID=2672567 RepID=A0A6B3W5K7_9BACI|nr:ABC transporter permease [Bacillus aquiflavi]MBA4537139.1 ABC transporter permease [Bacillus aquiflavi]NEY82724.1 ABC transporter permease [Bacillus aquiflavi]